MTGISNTKLEKKFEEYKTLENDRADIRNIFQIADYERKIEIIKYIDSILLKFNEIHEETKRKQIEAINKGVEDILANLSIFRNDEKVTESISKDVLAELELN